MLNEAGEPKPEIFVSDNLHMNRKGYELWRDAVCPVLISNEEAHEKKIN
jgi:lysophospholipase L1-like esterase